MTPDERLDAAAGRFADLIHEAISVRVKLALALERDRHDAEIAELRDEINTVAEGVAEVARLTTQHVRDNAAHSVRVP